MAFESLATAAKMSESKIAITICVQITVARYTAVKLTCFFLQVSYMYYLLGHKLWEKIEDLPKKQLIAENTYILTLDGDVDFQPSAVHLLVDLMKKNKKVGSACGRIHPIGTGT